MTAVRYQVDCPTCGAFAGFACRTLTTMRTTDTHMARIDAAYAPTTPRETDEMPEEGGQ